MRRFLLFTVMAVIVVVALGMVGCSSKPGGTTTTVSPTTTNPGGALAQATLAADTMMRSFQDKSLAEYVKYGDAQFKAAVTQAIFDQLATQMQNQYGNFISNTFLSSDNAQGYNIFHFKAVFQKGDVGLRIVLDSDNLVAGQFFEALP